MEKEVLLKMQKEYKDLCCSNGENIYYFEKAYKKYMFDIRKTHQVYLYLYSAKLQAFVTVDKIGANFIKRYDSSETERIYQDIELGHCFPVPISQCQDFEKQNTVIIPQKFDLTFNAIQKEFYKLAITYGDDEAINIIKNKYLNKGRFLQKKE